MKAEPLPYDMGNAGDFIKHGLIAEYCEWWFTVNHGMFKFVDPFGGRPCVSPPNPEVARRLHQLPECALKRAQTRDADRYYGSGNIVRNTALQLQRRASIKVSDRNALALRDLLSEGFESITYGRFNTLESFSILDTDVSVNDASFILIDPFDDFLPEYANSVVPKLPQFVVNRGIPVTLFVLCKDWNSELGFNWQRLKNLHLTPELTYLSIACGKIESSQVKGESQYNSEAILLLPPDYAKAHLESLLIRLQKFCRPLGGILGQAVSLKCNWVE
ncbi:hypothetical protein [Kaarinaea lacus]